MSNSDNQATPSSNEPQGMKGIISPESYDADTPKVTYEGGRTRPLRITGTDGSEIGSGNDAEFYQKGLYSIYAGSETLVQSDKTGTFGRQLGNMTVDGVNWRHLMYEVGVSENWTNYGRDEHGSVEDERYKWYSNISQSNNIEAYKLLEEAPEPASIISDKEFARIEALRQSVQTHFQDASEGVLDQEEAKATIKELMSNPDLLSAAQKRRWYEKAIKSDVADQMLATWNDPLSRSELERQQFNTGRDTRISADTSYWGMTKNAFSQQFGKSDKFKFGTSSGSHRDGTYKLSFTEEQLNSYISENDISPDVAAKMYDDMEQNGTESAIELADSTDINRETLAIDKKIDKNIDKEKSFDTVAKYLYNGAAPYIVDPTTYIAGGGLGKAATKITYQKVASPLLRRAMQSGTIGAATGFGESVAFTTNNYKEFTNQELLETWAMDAGMGGAFGSLLSLGKSGIDAYGRRAKERALDVDDVEYIPDMEPKFVDELQKSETRVAEMQDEIKTELVKGTEDVNTDVKVDTSPELKDDSLEEVKKQLELERNAGEAGARGVSDEVADPDAAAEAAVEAIQFENVKKALQHQTDVVQPAIEGARKKSKRFNILAKAHGLLAEREFATRMIKSADAKLSFIGTNILETGIGFTGKFKRKHSAALIKDSIYTRQVGNLNRAYVDNIRAYAMAQGMGKYKAFKASWEGGKVNDIAKQFHKEVFLHQEMLQMGRIPTSSPYVKKYVEQLNKTNEELFDGRIRAGVKGFDKQRRIKNYVPHIWKKVRVTELSNQLGEDFIKDLI